MLNRPSLGHLFGGFLSVGAIGFGGVMPWIRRMVVEQRAWLTPAEFTDTLALAQLLPGPNVTNLAVAIGQRAHGLRGALVAVAGLFAVPLAVIVGVGLLYDRFGDLEVVSHAVRGLAAAAAGLVLATALKIAAPLRHRALGAGVAAVAFMAVGVARLPLLDVLAGLAPLSVALAFWRRER